MKNTDLKENRDKEPVFAFIGAGNMAKAIIKGLFKEYEKDELVASTRTTKSASETEEELGIRCYTDNSKCFNAKIIVLCIKPQNIKEVLLELKERKDLKDKVIVTVVAGIPYSFYKSIIGDVRFVRSMPNTPCLIGEGLTGLYKNKDTDEITDIAEKLFKPVGDILWVNNEDDINKINAISGSGPAYFYAFIRSVAKAANSLGFSEKDSVKLATTTAIGASLMTKDAKTIKDTDNLISKVTSKGGTTIEAINRFDNDGLDQLVEKAVYDCFKRAEELSKEVE